MTFESDAIVLKWVIVKAPIIKRLRPFDPDILTTPSLIVTTEGVIEEQIHALNVEKNRKERKRRETLCALAKVLGKLFVDDKKLERMSLKGILETAVSIIQKVNEISLNHVASLNRETARKARLEARLKTLKAEQQYRDLYKQKINDAMKKKERLQKISVPEKPVPLHNTVVITSDKEDDVEIIPSPAIDSFKGRIRRKRRRSKIVEITDSSEDESSKDCIEVSDSDSVEITCISSKDDEDISMQPVFSESNLPASITPVHSHLLTPDVLSALKPTSAIQNLVKPIGIKSKAEKSQVTISNGQAKASWYIVPEGSPPQSSLSVNHQSVNNPSTSSGQSVNRSALKTVLVRKDAKGVVHLFSPKGLPKATGNSRFIPLRQPQSVLYKNLQNGTKVSNNINTSTIVGTVSVERRNKLESEGTSPTRVIKMGNSILKNRIPSDKLSSKCDYVIKIKQQRLILPTSSNDSLPDHTDSSNLLSHKLNIPLKNTNMGDSRPDSPSSSAKDDTKLQTPNTSNVNKNQTLMDSVVMKGPKLRFPKNPSPKGVKVLRPVEKH